MTEIKKIVFENRAHNGDVHVSRTFVRYVCDLFPEAEKFYLHPNNPKLVQDLPLTHLALEKYLQHPRNKASVEGDTLYLNTHYMANDKRYWNGCTLQTLYDLFKGELKEVIGHEITRPIEYFIPEIDYEKYDISKINHYLIAAHGFDNSDTRRKVLVCNNLAMSGQAHNFNMFPMIDKLAREHAEYLFLYTNYKDEGFEQQHSNVGFAGDLTQTPCDLNELSYLSNFCELIVGRGSGPYAFAIEKSNTTREVKFVGFCDPHAATFGLNEVLGRKQFYSSMTQDWQEAYRLVSEHL